MDGQTKNELVIAPLIRGEDSSASVTNQGGLVSENRDTKTPLPPLTGGQDHETLSAYKFTEKLIDL